ncbi:penicillin-binding transpeptidase domain-containing protein [Anaeromicropila populeti]|uniref:beta-lactamase n=1 Tax=Anaeromicropila populeti TaxID=37658 RepID=A0A1I6LKL5_9FIRM|nr:penicillin-binding transpeptidase domain-containing protein [Anaeromicropila populeti]SFS03933.1 bla regulator protein blaR1 [Anaeromicropila populeti]
MTRKLFCVLVLLSVLLCGCSERNKLGENDILSQAEEPIENSTTEVETEMQEQEDEIIEIDVDYSEDFKDINGCAVVLDEQKNQVYLYQDEMCKTEVSPYSSFKIISTLMGLHNNVIDNQNSHMLYDDSINYPIEEWNTDINLAEAFRTSCIWYFRQVLNSVGQDKVAKELTLLGFGNCDCSEWNGNAVNPLPDLNGFWIDSTLKISPYEWVMVLKDILEGNSIYGKMGTGLNGKAWFVGWAEGRDKCKLLAIYLDDSKNANNINGKKAREIAGNILENLIEED